MNTLREPPRRRSGLRTPVPFNYRTFVFAFFTGSILSFPFGLALALIGRPFDPPDWTAEFYITAIIVSVALLPFWSALALREEPVLRRLGLTISALGFALFVLGLFFSAL